MDDTTPQNDAAFEEVDVPTWELTPGERRIYEAGFMAGYFARDPEIAQLGHEADRLYRVAFDHRNCSCWKGHGH